MKNLIAIVLLLSSASLGCKMIEQLRSGSQTPSNNSNVATAPSPSTQSSPTSSGDPSTVTAGADPRQELIATSKRFMALPYFAATIESDGEGSLQGQLQYQAPDRFRFKMNVGGTKTNVEMLMIGKDSYMKLGDKWQSVPGAGGGSGMKSMVDVFNEKSLDSLKDVTFVGEDNVDGRPAYKYTYASNMTTGGSPFKSTIWIGKNSGVPMKIFVDYETGKLKTLTINYDTDSPVSIEKPD